MYLIVKLIRRLTGLKNDIFYIYEMYTWYWIVILYIDLRYLKKAELKYLF